MTTPQHPEEHCGHECVCAVLAVGGIEGDRSPCDFTGCKHDTRSHSPAAAPVPALADCKRTCDPDIRDCCREQRQQAAAEAQEKVLDRLDDWAEQYMENECQPSGGIFTNANKQGRLDAMEALCKKIASLRWEGERK